MSSLSTPLIETLKNNKNTQNGTFNTQDFINIADSADSHQEIININEPNKDKKNIKSTKIIDADLFKVKDHLLEHNSEITKNIENGVEIINGWSPDNTNTIQKWSCTIKELMKNYRNSAIKYEKARTLLIITPIIITGIIMIVSFLQVSTNNIAPLIGEKNIIFINIGFCITNFLFASLSTLINALMKIKRYDTKISNLIKIIEKLYGFNRILETEISLSSTMRNNANKFINKYASYYSTLLDIDTNFALEDLQL